jgi:putative spermidine/putrescine transport system permease protein
MAGAGTGAERESRRPRLPRGGPVMTPLLLAAPAAVLYLLLFVLPFGNLLLSSFYDYSRLAGIIKTLSFKNYARFWLDPFYLDILLRTFRISIIATLATLVIGYPVALYMSRASARTRGLVTLVILSPLLISVVVRSFGWLIILGPNGLLDSALKAVGFAGGNIMYTEAAVIVGLVNVFLPYLILSVVASLQTIDPAVPLAASSLGATRMTVFRRIIFPLSLPGVIAGSLIVFCLASSAFVTPAMLGGSSIKVLSVLTYREAMVLQNWPFAAAIAVSLLAVVVLIIGSQAWLLGHRQSGVHLH